MGPLVILEEPSDQDLNKPEGLGEMCGCGKNCGFGALRGAGGGNDCAAASVLAPGNLEGAGGQRAIEEKGFCRMQAFQAARPLDDRCAGTNGLVGFRRTHETDIQWPAQKSLGHSL